MSSNIGTSDGGNGTVWARSPIAPGSRGSHPHDATPNTPGESGVAPADSSTVTRVNVSAIIPIYQPDSKVLNRCLQCVAPQVDEVIVSAEGNSVVPRDMIENPKIKLVQTIQVGLQHSGNANFGAMNSIKDWLLILNDDVFLNDDAVEQMTKVIQPDTGIVVHFLRYPDRRIFATVCSRKPGETDFERVDNLKTDSSLNQVMEIENACGASWLINRKAFESVGGYDAAFPSYCNDNDLSLRIRRAGWKILYTPHAKGWHVGHQSFRKLGDPNELCKPGIVLFKQRWGRYLEWNRNRVPGNFKYV